MSNNGLHRLLSLYGLRRIFLFWLACFALLYSFGPSVACDLKTGEVCDDWRCSRRLALLVQPLPPELPGLYQGGLGFASLGDLFSDFENKGSPKQGYYLGTVSYLERPGLTHLHAFFSNTRNDFFVIRFYFSNKRAKNVPAHLVCKYDREANQIRFMGALVKPEYRDHSIFKRMMKFLFAMTSSLDATFSTEVMKKPGISLFFTKTGFIPKNRKYSAIVGPKNPEHPQILNLYPVGFGIKDHLIKSQSLSILKNKPPQGGLEIFLNTEFEIPKDAQLDQLDSVLGLPGSVNLSRLPL